jgi:N-acetylglucosaminyldiphosphoundecaprenol N-acetyl-beta-D-mannosaminyltransferase
MKVPVGNTWFDDVTMEEAVARIVAMVQGGGPPGYVCTGNLDHLVMLQKDADFHAIYARADLVLADGMPVVWLSRLGRGGRLRERVAGSDLFWELARVSAARGLRLFYLGGLPGAAEQAAAAAEARYPGAQICGIYCPPFETFATDAEQERVRATIRATRPDVLLVALGAPKQEKWIAANLERLEVPVSIGVGGSFEMASGIIRRAPRWMQRVGMEWLHRMLQEPGRLSRRYLSRDLPFLVRLTFRTLGARPPDTG